MDPDHLWQVAEEEAARSNFRFEGGSAYYLEQLIRETVERLNAEGAGQDPEKAADVERAVRLWVYAMVLEAERLGLDALHEPTFFGARERLCPGFWPFC